MTEETINLAEKLISFYNWENDKTVQRVHFGLKPNELKLAEAYLEKEKGKYCKRKEDIESKSDFWYQYITVDNLIYEKEGSLSILDDFFKQCFTSKQAILFNGMIVVAIYKIDDVTGHFYLSTYNTDSRYYSIVSKLKNGFERVNSSLSLDNL